jgi:hypothetical protein
MSSSSLIPFPSTSTYSLRERHHVKASDVWAFAVLAFEVFSLGQQPLFEKDDRSVIQFLVHYTDREAEGLLRWV